MQDLVLMGARMATLLSACKLTLELPVMDLKQVTFILSDPNQKSFNTVLEHRTSSNDKVYSFGRKSASWVKVSKCSITCSGPWKDASARVTSFSQASLQVSSARQMGVLP